MRTFAGADPTVQDQDVSITKAAENAIMLAGYQIRAVSANFTTALESDIPTIRGNLHRITQAVINVLLNAAESITGPGKTISLSVSYRMETKQILVEVRDEGCGIPADDLPKVTDPFFTTKRHSGGRGLGLSIVERIVRDHDGQMRIHSESGAGTVVTLTFPVSDEPDSE
jgi:C4-dicarboxylate-specific signal transduction histidine kinase